MESIGDYEYLTKDLLGHGAFAVVFKGRHKKHHDQVVAIKSISKKNIGKSQTFIGKEIKILQEVTKLHHGNVVSLLQCVETPQKLFIVIEFCNGGDLAEYLLAKGSLSEDTIKIFLRQIAEAVKLLNSKGVVHRDLKPQNILLCHSGKENPAPSEITLKIADFGFARFLQDGVMAATLCGSPMYMAPEVIMSLKYDAKADLWSIGTIVFQCLTGKAPFMAPNPPALKQFYEKNANLAPRIPSGTSPELTELLLGLMKRDAKDRMEFDQFFNHPFLMIERPQSSSPVPVPCRRSLTPEHMSPCSPPSSCGSSAPQCWEREVGGEDMAPCPLSDSHMNPSKLFQSGHSSSSPIEQDYVVVPRNIVEEIENYELNSNSSPRHQMKPQTRVPCKVPVCNSAYRKSGTGTNINLSKKAVSYQPHGKTPEDSSRPASLPMTTASNDILLTTTASNYSYQNTEPVPVPNKFLKSRPSPPRVQTSTSNQDFCRGKRSASPEINATPPRDSLVAYSEPIAMQRTSSNSSSNELCKMADISSLTPPPVQFSIGTPPAGGRIRTYSNASAGTPPPGSGRQTPNSWRYSGAPASSSASGSPLRRSGNTPPCAPVSSGGSSLSPVLASPTGKTFCRGDHYRCHTDPFLGNVKPLDYRNVNNSHCPLRVAFAGRTMTLPEFNSKDLWPSGAIHESEDQDCFLQRSGSSGKLCDPYFALGHFNVSGAMPPSPPGAAMMPYNQQLHHHHHHHPCSQPTCHMPYWTSCSKCSPARTRRFSGSGAPYFMESPPTNHFFCGGSPQFSDTQHFCVPELTEETLLEKEHNETLAKLNYVSSLVECILELAKIRSSPLSAMLTDSMSRKEMTNETMSEGYQHASQLLLYMKALQLLNSSLHLSKQEIDSGNLQRSTSVKNVLQLMKEQYHFCFNKCKSLNTLLHSTGYDLSATNFTADEILYNYAIEMCQSAALGELFGEPKETFRRYQTAQILLHSLSQQVNDVNDKQRLHNYRDAVEKRLSLMDPRMKVPYGMI